MQSLLSLSLPTALPDPLTLCDPGLPVISAWPDTRYSKTGTNPHVKVERDNPRGGKGFQKQARIRGTPLHPLLGVPQAHPATQP